MSIMEDKITNRDGVAIRIIRFDDGSTLEMLADLEASEQDKIISAHQRNADAQPTGEAPSHDAGSWAEKTSFAPGIKDDGTFYTEEEVNAMLESLEPSGPQTP